MRTLFICISVIFLFQLNSCKTETKETVKEVQVETVASEVELILNDGAKWKVSPEMMPHINASINRVDDYLETSQTDYKKLAKVLTLNNNKLISSCNMRGAAHDELHKWLAPHLQFVEDLDNSVSEKVASKNVEKIKASFEKLNEYFE